MQKQANQLQKSITYVLLAVGILGMGFLAFLVVDQLVPGPISSPPEMDASPIESALWSRANPEVEPATEPDTSVTEAVTSETDAPSDVPTGIRIRQRAPDFSLRSLDNEVVSLSDFLGKVVILDFWASWCGPCRDSMPRLEAIAQSLAADVVLLGVNLDRKEETAASYLANNNFDGMVALHGSYAEASAVSRTYGVTGIPKTFVIDRTGIVRYVGHPASLSRQVVEGLF